MPDDVGYLDRAGRFFSGHYLIDCWLLIAADLQRYDRALIACHQIFDQSLDQQWRFDAVMVFAYKRDRARLDAR